MGFNPEPLFTPENIPACTRHLGGELMDYDSDKYWVKIKFTPRPEFSNPIGHVQGGFVTAMLDECFSLAAFLPFDGGMICPTVENKTQYLRPAPMETLIGEGRVLKSGKSIVFSEATLSTKAGVLIAKATATSIPKPFSLPKR